MGRSGSGSLALEQPQAELALQVPDQAGGRGLGHGDASRRAVHIALLVERYQQQDLAHLEARAQVPVGKDPGGRALGGLS